VTTDKMLALVDESAARLLAAVSDLTDAEAREPSLLPGWTRAHVLSHLARNADALSNLLTWARTGDPTPMYPSQQERNRAIEEGARQSVSRLRDEIGRSHVRFAEAAAALPEDAWAARVEWGADNRGGPASFVPVLRALELELHHTDLGLAHLPAAWPCDLVKEALPYAADGLDDRAGEPLVLQATDTWATLEYGGGAGRTVEGPQAALLAWVTGRSDGADLAVVPEGGLPEIGAWR
jgi:maleylpyruvate isomerase